MSVVTVFRMEQESIPLGDVPQLAGHDCFISYQISVGGVGTEMNKFEQVSSNGHHMSLTGGPVQLGTMCHGQ